LTALAKGIVPFVRDAIAEVRTPLEARTTELENVVGALVQSAAGRHE
jgi:hypothetical protein